VHCGLEAETIYHLCLSCPFSDEVLSLLADWNGIPAASFGSSSISLDAWWGHFLHASAKESRRSFSGLIIYDFWNVWKERNRRIFQHRSLLPSEAAFLAHQDLSQCRLAMINEQFFDFS
jgi:hypothetical protein